MKEDLLNALYAFMIDKEKENQQLLDVISQTNMQIQQLSERIQSIEKKLSEMETDSENKLETIITSLSSNRIQSPFSQSDSKPKDTPPKNTNISPIFVPTNKKIVQDELNSGRVDDEQVPQDKDKKLEKGDEEQKIFSLPNANKSLRNAFSIGDKFLFQRELFGGNGELLQKTLSKIEKMNNIEEVNAFLEKSFKWDVSSEAYRLFSNAIAKWFTA